MVINERKNTFHAHECSLQQICSPSIYCPSINKSDKVILPISGKYGGRHDKPKRIMLMSSPATLLFGEYLSSARKKNQQTFEELWTPPKSQNERPMTHERRVPFSTPCYITLCTLSIRNSYSPLATYK